MHIRKALVSVWNKEGLIDLCRKLKEFQIELFATEGTAAYLKKEAGLDCRTIESVTEFPEMMDGRVKTLHPRVFGGILARRDVPKDLEQAATHSIPLFDLVVGNLYPFAEHLGKTVKEQVPFVDIGGPSMIRAAAKNHVAVAVVSDPSDYAELLSELAANKGSTTEPFRLKMAARTFARTSRYDSLIASQWEKGSLPTVLPLAPQSPLRYGENPHQSAVWAGTATWKALQGKELSYNNLLDAEAALALVNDFSEPAVAIIKHNNPCGAASGKEPVHVLFDRAFHADEKSAFGGVVALNRPVDMKTAERLSPIFLEVVIAPSFEPAAREILEKKKNLRLVEVSEQPKSPWDIRRALGGWLVQSADTATVPTELKSVTQAKPTEKVNADLLFAWIVCKHVRSNAIVLVKDGTTLGIGAGQMSRVDAVENALRKSPKEMLRGAVLASDAFFPFRDNIDLLKGLGISAVIQPGGSQRDAEVIQACDEQGLAMVFTGQRHFRH